MLCKGKLKLSRIVSFLPLLAIMSGCADIRLKTNDPELRALEKFAQQVTLHLLEANPNTYKEYQTALTDEIAPDALAQLKKSNFCASSPADIAKNTEKMTKSNERCAIQIGSASFPGKATAAGLIPVEVYGTAIKTKNYTSKGSKFDVLYLIGTNAKTKHPVMASVQVKEF